MAPSGNKIIIIAAPSGAGKTSIVKYLLKQMPEQLAFSISCTTRSPRTGETDGVEYYFTSVEDFEKKISKSELAEWEMVYFGKYYGTPVSELERIWEMGKTPLLDIDVKGGLNVRKRFPDSSLALFIQGTLTSAPCPRNRNARITGCPHQQGNL